MHRMFAWDDARYFLALHRTGSLSAAGRQLGVNQSTVGRRIAALEETLAVRLFDHTPDGYSLTPVGERFLARAERIEDEALATMREISGQESKLTGTVRLTAPDGFGAFFVAPRLAAFHARYPEIDIELAAENRTLSLLKREADLALRTARPKEPSLVSRRLAGFGNALYASREYLDAHGTPRAPDYDSSGHHFIGFDDVYAPVEREWLEDRAQAGRVVFRTNSTFAMFYAARAGIGLAHLPCYMGDSDDALVRVMPPEACVRREVWLVVHRDLRASARVRACVDFLAQVMAETEPILLGARRR